MILTCPSCGTQYVVKDGAIPPQGRQVRCASCKHSWHQDPEPAGEPEGVAAVEPAVAPEPIPEAQSEPWAESQEDESLAEATLIEPRSGPEAEERAYEEAVIEEGQAGAPPDTVAEITPGSTHAEEAESVEPALRTSDWREPPQAEGADDEFSPFAAADEVAPRRRGAIVPILLFLILVAAVAAAFWFFAPPEWKARLGVGSATASPLALVTTHMDRQRLESGNELLTVTGRVINPTSKDQAVPPLQAQLRTRTGQVVYSWTIAPPAQTLPPGASASFNSAEVNVPPGGDELTITLGPPKA
jgi:predicted Zn finger-like uncharacterized protein